MEATSADASGSVEVLTAAPLVETPKEEFIPKSQLEHALKDVHRFKDEAKKAKEELKTRQLQELKEKEQWQQLAELKDKELIEEREARLKSEKTFVNGQKFLSLKETALRAGLQTSAVQDLKFLALDDLQVEVNENGVNVVGVEKAVERLKTLRPHWFGSTTPPSININSPSVVSGASLTAKDYFEAEKKAIETGDYSALKALSDKMKNQGF